MIVIAAVARFTSLLVVLPLHILVMIRQRHIEIKRLVPLIESQPYEGVLSPSVLDLEHEVPGRIEHGLDGGVTLAREDEAGGEKLAGGGIFQADLAAVLAGDDAEAAGPDLVGLEPLAALVAAAGGARGDFVDGDLANHQEGVLERLLLLLERHRFFFFWMNLMMEV